MTSSPPISPLSPETEEPPKTWEALRPLYFLLPGMTDALFGRMQELALQVAQWNENINLISRKDIQHLPERHILYSLAITHYLQFVPGTRVLDLGTGGGFPGLPLALMFPETQFTLLDSTQKKLKVVNSVAEALRLLNVETVWQRAEDHAREYDFVTGRAVADLGTFYSLTRKLIHCDNQNALPNGVLYLKGGDVAAEMKGLRVKRSKLHNLADWLPGSFFETKRLAYLSNCG